MSDTEAVNLKEKYISSTTWQEKVVLMHLFHQGMCLKHPNMWNMKMTASHFGVSMGLVSENIRLAKEISGERSEKLMKAKTRDDGLKLIERRKYPRDRNNSPLIKD
jgi:hypothetical protein